MLTPKILSWLAAEIATQLFSTVLIQGVSFRGEGGNFKGGTSGCTHCPNTGVFI